MEQRAAALRCAAEEVSDGMLHMISDAARELRVDHPAHLATDVGPLIDTEAFDGIGRTASAPSKPSGTMAWSCDWRRIAVIASLLAICVGASVGAVLRWALALALNATFPLLPLGTLVANLGGGYLIGVALAVFGSHPAWAPEWRLLVVTGFLGGLTTFSTFSAEVTTLIQQGRMLWAGLAISVHVVGSLAMTLLGLATVAWLKPA